MSIATLNKNIINSKQHINQSTSAETPTTVLQIGEGNFLRGFFDWMLYETKKQGLYKGGVAVVQPRPTGKPKIDALARQDGLYTLVTRGLEQGKAIERHEVISVFNEVFDPYSQWQRFLELAKQPSLRIVVSNTTEAGLAYREEELVEGKPILSYPGKLTLLLYHRYLAFQGDANTGLICLPCELLERNGDTLLECVLRHIDDWQLPEQFKQWVIHHNRFLNSLVDRIVTGYPQQEQAEAWFQQWGYQDSQLTTAEPYHLWAIEGEEGLSKELPFAQAGLNVLWVEDLKPYQQRKVRILNGAHTFMALLGLLNNVKEVRLAMEHQEIGALVKHTVETEIIAALPYHKEELQAYAKEVYDRFLNPFIQHRLADIAMNSLSKYKTRLLPSLQYYLNQGEEKVPNGLLISFVALLRYYQITEQDGEYYGKTFSGESYLVRDDIVLLDKLANYWSPSFNENYSLISDEADLTSIIAGLLAIEELWGSNLQKQYPFLAEKLVEIWKGWEV